MIATLAATTGTEQPFGIPLHTHRRLAKLAHCAVLECKLMKWYAHLRICDDGMGFCHWYEPVKWYEFLGWHWSFFGHGHWYGMNLGESVKWYVFYDSVTR